MKRISEILESVAKGSPIVNNGITNRYTPINNIITNVKNLYGATYNIVVTEGSMNSIELRCSRWVNCDKAMQDICGINVGNKDMATYISEQGLTELKLILEMGKIMAVFYAPDIKNDTTKVLDKVPDASEYTDDHAYESYNEYEILKRLVKESGWDEELVDQTPKEIRDIVTSIDKIKAAERLEQLISAQMQIPDDYYFKAVRDKDGNESIALRHKYKKRRPFGKTAEQVESIMNIYGDGDQAIWVDKFEDKENIPEDMKLFIENVLRFLGAEETADECIFALNDIDKKDDNVITPQNLENNPEDDGEGNDD